MPDASAKTESYSAQLAAFTHGLRHDDIPEAVRRRARHLILDAIGLGLAATRHNFAAPMLRGIQALGEGGGSPVLGSPATLTPRNAVLMNAALMHGLDYDDTHMKAIVHGTAFSAPTALACAHEVGATGRDPLYGWGLLDPHKLLNYSTQSTAGGVTIFIPGARVL